MMRRATVLGVVVAVAAAAMAITVVAADGGLPWHARAPQLARDSDSRAPTVDPSTEPASPGPPLQINIAVAFPRLPPLDRPTNMLELPSHWMLVTLQDGRIVSFPNESAAASLTTVLDMRTSVSRDGNEEGLLGLARDPAFTENGFIYVYYSARPGERRTILSRLQTGGAGANLRFVPGSELIILTIPQPFSNHNGGQVGFGPDGMLYLGLGDGGSAGDPSGDGQDLKRNLLGSIIRVDVRNATAAKPYAIPPDNPWATSPNGERAETWAYGLRNPWRFSWDHVSGRMIAGDVGQDSREEVDIIEKGKNYGWSTMEGLICYKPRTGCARDGLSLPVVDYPHEGGACSITGGYVYHGQAVTQLAGAYIYADFCNGAVRAIPNLAAAASAQPVLLVAKGPSVASFAEDEAGELYLLSFDGKIYSIGP